LKKEEKCMKFTSSSNQRRTNSESMFFFIQSIGRIQNWRGRSETERQRSSKQTYSLLPVFAGELVEKKKSRREI
jgi:hypothetical protein